MVGSPPPTPLSPMDSDIAVKDMEDNAAPAPCKKWSYSTNIFRISITVSSSREPTQHHSLSV